MLPRLTVHTLAASFAVLAAVGCNEPAQDATPTRDRVVAVDLTLQQPIGPTDASAPEGPVAGDVGAPRVREIEALGTPAACPDPRTCVDGYLEFIDRAAEYAQPVDFGWLEAQLTDVLSGRVTPRWAPLSEPELRAGLVEAMNIGFLLDGIDDRPLEVVVRNRSDWQGYRSIDLTFRDPMVGDFDAQLTLPNTPGKHPVTVVHPGHWESAAGHRELRQGRAFLDAGIALLALSPRVNGADGWESYVTEELLLEGFTFMGLRVYETLLLMKYAAFRPDLDEQRMALLGHSGGSVVSNLTVRLRPDLVAYVLDLTSEYINWYLGEFIDETAPSIWDYFPQINDFTTSSVPVHREPYGYEGDVTPTVDFLRARLALAG